ncbi:hypothetical protein LJR034_003093 [Caballeronia sp. LjRoot34]|uniref:DUF7024 domain-containing protein n=1 Tax=Caballeronia sp. LjRoot34 TaxID=3342325 RepID=UPI003ECE4EAC
MEPQHIDWDDEIDFPMDSGMILAHVWNIGTGIGATLIVVAFVYLLGVALTPATAVRFLSKPSLSIALGASVSIVWCWYGIKFNITLPVCIQMLAILAAIILLVRCRKLTALSQLEESLRTTPFFIAAFATFYTLSYFFLAPPTSTEYLPIARIMNNDIFNYFIITQYLQKLGTPNIAGFSFFDTPSMMLTFTPGVFTVMQGVATVLHGDVLAATMPAIFAITALIGCAAVQLARGAFNVSKSVGFGIAAAFICGPFFRYLVSNYFLSSLIGMLFVMLLLVETVAIVSEPQQRSWIRSIASCAPLYVVIFYCYPPLFIIGVGVQLGFVATVTLVSCWQKRGEASLYREMGRAIAYWTKLTLICLVIVIAVDPAHLAHIFRFLFLISQKGDIGWPLDFISPAAIFGFPSRLQLHGARRQTLGIALSLVIAGALLLAYWRRRGAERSVAGFALFTVAVLALCFYFFYFFRSGPTYQQWKMASYLPLLLSISLLGAVHEIFGPLKNEPGAVKKAGFLLVYALLTVGNIVSVIHERRHPETFSSKYENLKALDMLGGPSDLYVKMSSFSSTFFAAYFIQQKKLHLLSASYYTKEDMKLEDVSRNKPLFLEGDSCASNEHNITIADVGCLYFSPPSLPYGRQYRIDASTPGVASSKGLSDPEVWGTWSNAFDVDYTVLLDTNAVPNDKKLYLNIEVQPLVLGNSKSQKVQVSWGKDSHMEQIVDKRKWISLPYLSDDLAGFAAREMSIRIHIPGAVAPHSVDPNNPETRLLGIGFLALSVSDAPKGQVPEN